MRKYAPTEQLVIVLTEHPVFGLLLIPYTSEKRADGTVLLLEQKPFHASAETMSRMSGIEQQAITIASHYTEKYLMEVSQEKTVSRFLHKLSGEPGKVQALHPSVYREKVAGNAGAHTPGRTYRSIKSFRAASSCTHHLYRIHRKMLKSDSASIWTDRILLSASVQLRGKAVSIREQKP